MLVFLYSRPKMDDMRSTSEGAGIGAEHTRRRHAGTARKATGPESALPTVAFSRGLRMWRRRAGLPLKRVAADLERVTALWDELIRAR